VARGNKQSRQSASGHRFKHHEIELPEGVKLVLAEDGTIVETGADGTAVRTWLMADPEWARVAIRFGVQPPSETAAPDRIRPDDTRLRLR
jgi:hypothetical protein